jgi:hypothetical protein
VVVADPDAPANKVLSFNSETYFTGGGDLFTQGVFTTATGTSSSSHLLLLLPPLALTHARTRREVQGELRLQGHARLHRLHRVVLPSAARLQRPPGAYLAFVRASAVDGS